jgi:hypothetical protein
VINLSPEKQRVISGAFRVLNPGGRFAVSDVVFLGEKDRLLSGVARSVEVWSGCVSGVQEKGEERRGKWSFCSLDREAAGQLLSETAAHLDGSPSKDG